MEISVLRYALIPITALTVPALSVSTSATTVPLPPTASAVSRATHLTLTTLVSSPAPLVTPMLAPFVRHAKDV